ncbi:hypothetical protein KFZ70_10075 [Tamlana fucoidanivorans]|uniref:Uncharacterized protein n=1 Tax=Allotamlana fucoidanivorans TaxID=2583814 RepID=A0A5C4SNU7_9FLAO|nr:hypothetical protein [Tamlana fucoidanivorans]TNJ45788.1 hypothetical protein FGF67_05250 [Tamlana fucoidanivorans]
MKRIPLLLILLIVSTVRSQSYIGFMGDNYNGVHNVINNPANIVSTPFKLDINLMGFNAFGTMIIMVLIY